MLGERSYKGKYTFDTAWIGDVIKKKCAYPIGQLNRGTLKRRCVGVDGRFVLLFLKGPYTECT